MSTSKGEAREYLLAIAEAEGHPIADEVLARWHRRGLIPRPWTIPLGRGLGTRTVYPVGTADQLRALLRYHRRFRNLDDVAWCLWWAGFPVPLSTIRSLLRAAAIESDEAVITAQHLNEAEVAEYAQGRLDSKALRRARKSVGSDQFPAFLWTVMRVASGDGTALTLAEDSKRFDVGAGTTRGRTDKVLDDGPMLGADASEGAIALSRVLADGFTTLLDSVTDEELDAYRDELRLFIDSFTSIGETTAKAIAPGAFGLTAFSKMMQELGPSEVRGLLLVWIGLRRREETSEPTELLEAGRRWLDSGAPSYEALMRLADDVPAFAPLLTRRRLSAALRSERAQARFNERLAAAYRANEDAVKDFVARNPDVRELLDKMA